MLLTPGLRVQFQEEKQAYTVQAANSQFAICTKPFNAQKTVLYTIIDWAKGIRGPEGVVFSGGAETPAQCRAMLKRLTIGQPDPTGGPWFRTQVSHRNRIRLRLRAILAPRGKR